MTSARLKESILKSLKALYMMLPVIIGTVLLLSLITPLIPKSFYLNVFRKNVFLDSIIGSIFGSISAGNPITSYILGGEFLKEGVSLVAVTAFLVAWVTVGLIQLPAEAVIIDKKFALIRNLTSFLFSIIVGIVTAVIVNSI
jgi:uncharacterized membrane protein YraQ (UPF0718 family)